MKQKTRATRRALKNVLGGSRGAHKRDLHTLGRYDDKTDIMYKLDGRCEQGSLATESRIELHSPHVGPTSSK